MKFYGQVKHLGFAWKTFRFVSGIYHVFTLLQGSVHKHEPNDLLFWTFGVSVYFEGVCVFGVKKVVIIRPLILRFSHPTHFSKACMDRLIFNMDYIDLSLITFWKVYTIWLMNLHPLDWISCIFSNMLLSFLYECVVSICCVASAHFSCLKASPDIHTVYTFREKSFCF